ncbi:hypothetical protein Tco_1154169 [Tanacetum coccineum]
MFKRFLIAADQASVFMAMMIEQRSSTLVFHQMTSDHNRSELEIHDHSNEPSSSKLVPKVVPLAFKTATSRQELELLFHHHIEMLRTTGVSNDVLVANCSALRYLKQNALIESKAKRSIKISLGHIPFQTLVEHHQVHKLLSRVLRNIIVIFAKTFRVILFSIHNDEWKSFQCHHQTALRGSIKTVPKQRRAPSLKSKHCPEQPMHQRSPLVQFFWCCPLSPIVLHSLFFSHDLLDATTSLQNGPFNDKLKHST